MIGIAGAVTVPAVGANVVSAKNWEDRDARFLAAIRERLRARVGQFDTVGVSVADVPENFGGMWHKFVRLQVRDGHDLTFWQPFEVLSAEETTAAYWRRPWGWWSGINGRCGHRRELLETPGARKMRCLICEVRYHIENTHRDFSACYCCGVKTWGQHRYDCPRGAVGGEDAAA